MSNIWYAVDRSGIRVATFLSRDYDRTRLEDQYGPVEVFDQSNGGTKVEEFDIEVYKEAS